MSRKKYTMWYFLEIFEKLFHWRIQGYNSVFSCLDDIFSEYNIFFVCEIV